MDASKTATGVIRYGHDKVIAVIDSTKAGQDVAQSLGIDLGKGIPVVRDINEALNHQPDTLLIGAAPRGGSLPHEWRWQILTAIENRLDIINGLHAFFSEDEELQTAAKNKASHFGMYVFPPTKRSFPAMPPSIWQPCHPCCWF